MSALIILAWHRELQQCYIAILGKVASELYCIDWPTV